jgi:hypothetical protein
MIVVAADGGGGLAAGVWLIIAARALTSIPFVRAQIGRLHGRSTPASSRVAADVAAVVVAAGAVGLDSSLVAGAAAVFALVVIQQLIGRGVPPRPAVLGASQMLLGFGVVAVTAAGVLAL